MSICRRGDDSDLYIYQMACDGEVYDCNCCTLDDSMTKPLNGKKELVKHLRKHSQNGDKFPIGLANIGYFDEDWKYL